MRTRAFHKDQAKMIWQNVTEDVMREIHGPQRDFAEQPLNDGEWMTVRQRATPIWQKRLNRAQRRALGHRSHYLPGRMATIKKRSAA